MLFDSNGLEVSLWRGESLCGHAIGSLVCNDPGPLSGDVQRVSRICCGEAVDSAKVWPTRFRRLWYPVLSPVL